MGGYLSDVGEAEGWTTYCMSRDITSKTPGRLSALHPDKSEALLHLRVPVVKPRPADPGAFLVNSQVDLRNLLRESGISGDEFMI